MWFRPARLNPLRRADRPLQWIECRGRAGGFQPCRPGVGETHSLHGIVVRNPEPVIASEAKQSIPPRKERKGGLLRGASSGPCSRLVPGLASRHIVALASPA